MNYGISNLIELDDEIVMGRMVSLACNKANLQNIPLVMLSKQDLIIQAYAIEKIKALRSLIIQDRRKAPEFFFDLINEDVVDEILGLDSFFKAVTSIDIAFADVFDSFIDWSDILYGIQWVDAQSQKERKDWIKDARERSSLEKYLEIEDGYIPGDSEIDEEVEDQHYLLYAWHDQIKGIDQTIEDSGRLLEPTSDYYAPLTFRSKSRWYNKVYAFIKVNQNGLLLGSAFGLMAAFSIGGVIAYANTPTFGPEFWTPLEDNSEFNQLLSRLE